ncbi:30S ribosomal protein S9 [Candidatus Parcubacteria bacterium]|nr:30S ribosomal protein S9 [Candidatus Parcubacteria bacterium]
MENKKTTTKTKKATPKKEVEETIVEAVEKEEENIEEESTELGLSDKSKKYIEAIGRRKTATARVRIWTKGDKEILINDKPYKSYFSVPELQQTITASLEKMKCVDKFRVSIKVKGGGIFSQAEAVRHAIARALVKFNPEFRKRLKKAGHLTRDPRMRERKKFGLKRARRAPQWKKR